MILLPIILLLQLAILVGNSACDDDFHDATKQKVVMNIFDTRALHRKQNSIGSATSDKQLQRRLNRPFIASPEKAQTPVCAGCYSRGNGCLMVRITFNAR